MARVPHDIAEHLRGIHGCRNQAVNAGDSLGRLFLGHHRLGPVIEEPVVDFVDQ